MLGHFRKINDAAAKRSHIPRDDRNQYRYHRKEATEKDVTEYRHSQRHHEYDHVLWIYRLLQQSRVLAALPDSSSPISATTGPIAAGGNTTSIQSEPNL